MAMITNEITLEMMYAHADMNRNAESTEIASTSASVNEIANAPRLPLRDQDLERGGTVHEIINPFEGLYTDIETEQEECVEECLLTHIDDDTDPLRSPVVDFMMKKYENTTPGVNADEKRKTILNIIVDTFTPMGATTYTVKNMVGNYRMIRCMDLSPLARRYAILDSITFHDMNMMLITCGHVNTFVRTIVKGNADDLWDMYLNASKFESEYEIMREKLGTCEGCDTYSSMAVRETGHTIVQLLTMISTRMSAIVDAHLNTLTSANLHANKNAKSELFNRWDAVRVSFADRHSR